MRWGRALEFQDPVHAGAERLEEVVSGFGQASADHHGLGPDEVDALADGEGKGVQGVGPHPGREGISCTCAEQDAACAVHPVSRGPVVALGDGAG
jgi:hypothetical protein